MAWNKGLTKETDSRIMRNALSRIGQTRSLEVRQRIALARKGKGIGNSSGMKGKIPWNKGLTKLQYPKMSNSGLKKGFIFKTKKSKELFPKLSNSGVKKGNIPWNKGLSKTTDSRVNKISKSLKMRWKNPNFGKIILHRRIPSYPEQIFIKLCEEENLSYRYVGNGSLVIDGKNPDFVDSSGTKLIEIWGEHWHKEQNPQERIDFFKERGYECLIIKASELLNQEEIIIRIRKLGF